MVRPTDIDSALPRLEATLPLAPFAKPPEAAGDGAAGAPASNTAPANSIGKTAQVIRVGIDSLYVSFQGKLHLEWEQKLQELKASAQAIDPGERLQAQVSLGGHLFEVRDKGRGRAAYVLRDNWFDIAVAASSAPSVPVAYVQVSNEVLALNGLPGTVESLMLILKEIARIDCGPMVSRVDLCADFVPSYDLSTIEVDDWITRAREKLKRYVGRQFTGWSIGQGGDLSARLYDKLLEIQKSRKWYMPQLWAACGWQGEANVWRLEFQIRRDVLVEMGVSSLDDLLPRLESLWLYCCTDWLRLVVPNPSEQTPSRWLLHPDMARTDSRMVRRQWTSSGAACSQAAYSRP